MADHIDSFPAAIQLFQAGRLAEAETACRNIIAQSPGHGDALMMLGLICLQTGRAPAAVDCLTQAAAALPNRPEIRNNLGTALRAINRLDDAAAALREAIRLGPDYPQAMVNLAGVLRAKGQFQEAADVCASVIAQHPDLMEAHATLGNTLKDLGRLPEAAECFKRAIAFRPGNADLHCSLGDVAQTMENGTSAIAAYDRALQLDPRHVRSLINRGLSLRRVGRGDEAVSSLRKAVELAPTYAEAHESLATALWEGLHTNEALAHYQKAAALSGSVRSKVLAATLVPPIYASSDDATQWRRRLIDGVAALHADGVRVDITTQLPRSPFYVPYQPDADRDILRDIARLYAAPQTDRPPLRKRNAGDRIHVGFISALFKNQTVGLWMQGLIAQLPRDRFIVTVISVGDHHDDTANDIRAHADRYIVLPPALPPARAAILELMLDVLVFADLGMEPFTYALAMSRLSPVQCATWGHPATSGIETVDYYISSAMVETPDAQANYVEKLTLLKHPPLYYHRPTPPPPVATRDSIGLPNDAHVYGCLQSLFKLHPVFDPVLAAILRRDPKGIVILPQATVPRWEAVTLDRLRRVAPDVADRIRIIPRVDRQTFRAINLMCDAVLAPFPFGAGDTSLEAFALGVPTVTLPTPHLKGRITYGFYNWMGIMDCVADTVDQYVDIAVRLGTQSDFRRLTRERILAANGVLYENAAGVREMADFLESVAG